MVQALLEEVERFHEDTQPLDSYVEKEKQKKQKLALPVLSELIARARTLAQPCRSPTETYLVSK